MKKAHYVTALVFSALLIAPQVSKARTSASEPPPPAPFAEEESKDDDGPPEAVIRKLAAMMPDQKFKRGEKTTSKGGAAPEGTTVYPVQIQNADGSLLFDTNFFLEANGKWALVDSAGNVARE